MPSSRSVEPPADFPGDEIRLADIWRILVRRWKWIAACALAGLLLAVAYVVVASPVYEANARIRIGQVAGGAPFEAAQVLAARLRAQYGRDIADGVRRERPFLKRVEAIPDVPGAVLLVSEGDRPADAAALLQRVFAQVDEAHSAVYGENSRHLDERLANLDAQRVALLEQFEDTTSMLELLKQRDPAQASVLAVERSRISLSIQALDAERPGVAQKLVQPQSEPTRLLGEIAAPARAASPRKSVAFGLGMVLGLVAGLALAFGLELSAGSSGTGARANSRGSE